MIIKNSIKRFLLRLLARRPVNAIPNRSFLIPAYAGMGNFIMMTPMVLELRRLFPQARICVLAGNSFGADQVFRPGDGVVDEVWWLPDKGSFWSKVAFFLRLRGQKLGTAFVNWDASPGFYRWGVVLAGIPRRIGHTEEVLGHPMGWTRDILTDSVPLRLGTHESDLHFDLLEVLQPGLRRTYKTHVSVSDPGVLEKFGLTPKAYMVVQLSAANAMGSPKVWPAGSFAELIRRLEAKGEKVVLPGDEAERGDVENFVAKHRLGAIPLAGKTTISEVARLIKEARLLVCHDSGLMHIGNAVGTPLVALYGPTDWIFTEPKASTSRIVRLELPCQPCMKDFARTEAEAKRDCPIDIQCMKNLSVEQVFAACEEVMKGAMNKQSL